MGVIESVKAASDLYCPVGGEVADVNGELKEHPEYTQRLYLRVGQGEVAPPARVSIDDWTPVENDCHANVTTWCKSSNGFEIVRGWLYFDLAGLLPYVLFNAHSVIRDSAGELWDITPSRATDQYPFLVAEEAEDVYAQFIEGGVTRLRHYK